MTDFVQHGGTDSGAPIAHDFSTNANPLGPPPWLAAALQAANRTRYPDPHYAALRDRLAQWHGVAASRVLPSAGTSEAIRRLTLAAFISGVRTACVPQPGYGDYRAAAHALGIAVREYATADALIDGLQCATTPALVWLCEPASPSGQSESTSFWSALLDVITMRPAVIALDRAYEPLRLEGNCPIPSALADSAWQCFSPNKALGLTGVRAGYVLAPSQEALHSDRMASLAPSWVLSAEGVAVLDALPDPRMPAWLDRSRRTLERWKQSQRNALDELGWRQQASVVPFWLAQPDAHGAALQERLRHLRAGGIKLRDASSFGLPGWVRVSTQAPHSQSALVERWKAARTSA